MKQPDRDDLLEFLSLYVATYCETDHDPTVLEERKVMNFARAILAREKEWVEEGEINAIEETLANMARAQYFSGV